MQKTRQGQAPSATDCPAWVQADRAARWAWTQDKRWRQQAAHVAPPVHRPLGNGGTVGDQLLLLARRDYAREQAKARAKAPGPDLAHASDCICATCRRKRGERPLPTLAEQQERRRGKRVAGDDWRLSEESLARFGSLCTVYHDSRPGLHDVLAWLRTDFAHHLDSHQLFSGLERLLEHRPQWAAALIACGLLGRTAVDVAQQEGVSDMTIFRRHTRGREYLAAIYAGQEPELGRQRPEGSGALLAELDEASRLAQCPSISRYLQRVALAAP
jgi:hypothetical protein